MQMQSEAKRWRRFDKKVDTGGSYLRDKDSCYYYMEKIDHGYDKSRANQLIFNFKKPPDRKQNPTEWFYKEQAIEQFADDLGQLINVLLSSMSPNTISSVPTVLVPAISSKQKTNPEYDDRLLRVAEAVASQHPVLNVIDAFSRAFDIRPLHENGTRNPSYISAGMEFCGFGDISPSLVIILDDLLVSGATFVACADAISLQYPDCFVVGVFWARQTYKL